MNIRNYLSLFIAWGRSLNPWIKIVVKEFKLNRDCFGLRFALQKSLTDFNKKISHRYSSKWRANEYEHSVIEAYLIRRGYLNFMKETMNQKLPPPRHPSTPLDLTGNIGNKCPIWVCWWQGENSMPSIVKICYERLCKKSGMHPVILISLDNYSKYVAIPDFLVKKAVSHKLKFAHLADLLRLKLLAMYGGLWIDSTILLSRPIKNIYTDAPFMTLKNPPFFNQSVSVYRWSSFFMGAGISARPYMAALSVAMEKYLLTERSMIHYLLIDYFIDLLYKNSKGFKTMVDAIPCRNLNLHTLREQQNQVYDKNKWEKWVETTDFFKMSYHEKILEFLNGRRTYYGYIVNSL